MLNLQNHQKSPLTKHGRACYSSGDFPVEPAWSGRKYLPLPCPPPTSLCTHTPALEEGKIKSHKSKYACKMLYKGRSVWTLFYIRRNWSRGRQSNISKITVAVSNRAELSLPCLPGHAASSYRPPCDTPSPVPIFATTSQTQSNLTFSPSQALAEVLFTFHPARCLQQPFMNDHNIQMLPRQLLPLLVSLCYHMQPPSISVCYC